MVLERKNTPIIYLATMLTDDACNLLVHSRVMLSRNVSLNFNCKCIVFIISTFLFELCSCWSCSSFGF